MSESMKPKLEFQSTHPYGVRHITVVELSMAAGFQSTHPSTVFQYAAGGLVIAAIVLLLVRPRHDMKAET